MKVPGNLQGIRIPHFTESQWHIAKRLMDDAHTLHDTYAEFRQDVARAEGKLHGQGMATVRIPINVDEFIAWCEQTGRKFDSKARSHYTSIGAYKFA